VRSPTSTDRPQLTVILPAYNEAANIRAGALAAVVDFLRQAGLAFEVIVADDGSADETAELVAGAQAREPRVRLLRTHHGGKAHALVHGLQAARGSLVLFSDIDQAIPIAEAANLLPWFDRGFDIVVASRGLERRHATMSRRVISFGQLAARYVLLGFADITDTQCGFKAFRADVVRSLVDRLVVHAGARDERAAGPSLTPGFDVELLYVARQLGLRIKEVPVQVDHRRRGPRTNVIHDCVQGVRDLLAIRAAARQGRYSRP